MVSVYGLLKHKTKNILWSVSPDLKKYDSILFRQSIALEQHFGSCCLTPSLPLPRLWSPQLDAPQNFVETESPGGLVKMQIAGPTSRGPDSVSLVRTGIPKRRVCPRDANGADRGLSFTGLCSLQILCTSTYPHLCNVFKNCHVFTIATYLHSRGSKPQIGNGKLKVTCKCHLPFVAYSQGFLEVLPLPSVLNVAQSHLCLVFIMKTFPWKVHSLTSLQ